MQSLISDTTITNRKIYEISVDTTTTTETISHNLNTEKVATTGISGSYEVTILHSNSLQISLESGTSASCFVIVWV